MKYSDTAKWKVKVCEVGRKCWRRTIITVDGDEIVDAGRIDTAFAKYVVKLHNAKAVRLDAQKPSNSGLIN